MISGILFTLADMIVSLYCTRPFFVLAALVGSMDNEWTIKTVLSWPVFTIIRLFSFGEEAPELFSGIYMPVHWTLIPEKWDESIPDTYGWSHEVWQFVVWLKRKYVAMLAKTKPPKPNFLK